MFVSQATARDGTCCQWTLYKNLHVHEYSPGSTAIRYNPRKNARAPKISPGITRGRLACIQFVCARFVSQHTSERITFAGSRSQPRASHMRVMGNSPRCFHEKWSRRNWKCFTTVEILALNNFDDTPWLALFRESLWLLQWHSPYCSIF